MRWTPFHLCGAKIAPQVEPLVSEPDQIIRGGPSIRNFTVLNDKRQIVTRDTEGGVQVAR